MSNAQVRQYAGDVRIWQKDADGKLIPVLADATDPQGNRPIACNAKTFSYEAGETVSVVSCGRGAKYQQPIYSDTLPGTTSMSLTLLEQPPAILARVLFGEMSNVDVASGSFTDEAVTVADLALPVQLSKRWLKDTPAPVVKKGASTLVEGDDYRIDLRRGQITAVAGGDISEGDVLQVSASYEAVTGTSILGGATPTASFYITGDMEDRISKADGELTVYEARLTVDGEINWLATEPMSPTLTGALIVPTGAPAPYTFVEYKKA